MYPFYDDRILINVLMKRFMGTNNTKLVKLIEPGLGSKIKDISIRAGTFRKSRH